MNRDTKKNNKSRSNQIEVFLNQGVSCWRCSEKGHIQRDCKQKKYGEGKSKENDSVFITESNGSDALILILAGSNESWVIDSGVSFHTSS